MHALESGWIRRTVGSLLVALVVAGPGLAPERAEAITDAEQRMFRLVNGARQAHGLRSLRLSESASRGARRHSARMAEEGHLFHRCMSCMLRRNGWQLVGENVAYAATVDRAHQLLMQSAPHRANILCGCFTRIGIGIVRSGGWVWVTEIFYRP